MTTSKTKDELKQDFSAPVRAAYNSQSEYLIAKEAWILANPIQYAAICAAAVSSAGKY